MDDKRLLLIWTDILNEHGGKETVDSLKDEYSKLNISQLIEFLNSLLITEFENKPFRSRAEIQTSPFLNKENETIVYDESNIIYKDLLVSLVSLMFLTNVEDSPTLIIDVAFCLKEIDDVVSEQFRKDIAEKVYRTYR
ncbi:hypothetical protein Q8G35_12430 [Peribacillus simplex]|uniref:Uncharacterized protein n=2 Tax=Peribacillus TaxID=2675229 RepID=A0AA90T1D4_9BACI|nr:MULTISPECIES: hypothetical protein [Peribacillus]MDP1419218.1 hypothetical protein [Peribacillus simplex]MDP1452144.1 hypothetical protein [Peribacillus frigoritolerans]